MLQSFPPPTVPQHRSTTNPIHEATFLSVSSQHSSCTHRVFSSSDSIGTKREPKEAFPFSSFLPTLHIGGGRSLTQTVVWCVVSCWCPSERVLIGCNAHTLCTVVEICWCLRDSKLWFFDKLFKWNSRKIGFSCGLNSRTNHTLDHPPPGRRPSRRLCNLVQTAAAKCNRTKKIKVSSSE